MLLLASVLGLFTSFGTPAFVGITPELGLPPLWAYPASIALLILVGATSLGLAKLYVKVKVMLSRRK